MVVILFLPFLSIVTVQGKFIFSLIETGNIIEFFMSPPRGDDRQALEKYVAVEFDVKTKNNVVVTMDYHGYIYLMQLLSPLRQRNNDIQLRSPSWAGKELNEYNLSGKDYRWCPRFSIASVNSQETDSSGSRLNLYVEEQEDTYTVDIIGNQQGVDYLYKRLTSMNLLKDYQTIDLEFGDAVITDRRKQKSIATIRLLFCFRQ